MSRRKGQNPTLRIGKRNDGSQYFYFQYWLDVAGEDARKTVMAQFLKNRL